MGSAAPNLTLAPGLPITQHAETIAAHLKASGVVIVCGETGSGKSTQLPKLCWALGLESGGLVGHTQPRRIAARFCFVFAFFVRVSSVFTLFLQAGLPVGVPADS